MTPSPQSTSLRSAYVDLADRFSADPDMSLPAMREMFDTLGAQQAEPTGVTYEEVQAGDQRALWVRPVDAAARTILYLHGGGYISHDMHTSRRLAGHLAKAAGASALVPDYRLSPENPFPAPVDDAISAYRYLLEQGVPAHAVAFAGESAGGNLAAATIVRARELGLPLPAAYVGFSPWFDLLGELASFDTADDAFLTRPVSQLMAGMYLGQHDAHDHLTNPRFADLTGFPATFVTAGADESLVDAVNDFAEKARAAGVDTTLEVADSMQHAFQWMAGRAPEADESISRAGAWLKAHLTVGAGQTEALTNAARMQLVDDSWNARDWKTFEAMHDDACIVFWPGREAQPTHGVHAHQEEAAAFSAAFPDNRVHNQPYDILFGEGDYTCFVTRFTGTFTEPLVQPDGSSIAPTHKAFDLLYSTAARWRDGRIVEEYLFYDNGTFLQQIGLQ